RDVVDSVSGQGLNLDRLLRGVPLVFQESCYIEQRAARRVPKFDLLGQDLMKIFVLAADTELDVLISEPLCDRRDDVIGLVAFEFEDREAERLDHLPDTSVLLMQVLGRRVA